MGSTCDTRPRWSRIVREAQLMPEEEPIHASPIGPLDWLKAIPFEPAASSDRLGWVGLEAGPYRGPPVSALSPPALTHHRPVLFSPPRHGLDLVYRGGERHVRPPPACIIPL